MTLEVLMERIGDELNNGRGPINIRTLARSYYPDDMQAGLLLQKAFHLGLLHGPLWWWHSDYSDHISAIADNTRPVCH